MIHHSCRFQFLYSLREEIIRKPDCGRKHKNMKKIKWATSFSFLCPLVERMFKDKDLDEALSLRYMG